MKLENFKIHHENMSIEVGDKWLDLHNQYDFKSISYDILKQEVELIWRESPGNHIPINLPNYITLTFDAVSLFKINERDTEMPFTEDTCIQNICFIDDFENELYCSDEPRTEKECLFINFMSNMSIKILSDRLVAKVHDYL